MRHHELSEQQQQQQRQKRRQRKQQLVELEKLKQISKQMTQLRKKQREKSRNAPLYTGSVLKLSGTDGTNTNCELANNHGMSSDDVDLNEAAMLAAASPESASRLYCEDKGDSDSLCMEDSLPRQDQGEPSLQHQQLHSAEMRRHAVKCEHRYKQLQLCQKRQHQRQLIIPKRLQWESQSVQPQISSGTYCYQQQCDDQNDEIESADSDMIFPPTASITGSGNDESEVDSRMETGNGLQPAVPAHYSEHCNQPAKWQDQSAITDEDDCSASDQPRCPSYDSEYRQEYSVELSPYVLPPPPVPKKSQPPVSLTIDRQVVRLSSGPRKRHHHGRSDSGSAANKIEQEEICNEDEANVTTLMRQLRQIENCQRHNAIAPPGARHSKPMLCTSSSNCCSRRGSVGGGRGSSDGNSPDGSPESSMNLVSGTTILRRPGSLPGLNIDGMESRRMRCAHESLNDEDDSTAQNLVESCQARSNKKTDPNATPSEFPAAPEDDYCTEKLAICKVTSDANISDQDSEPIEYEAARRGSVHGSGGNVAYTVQIPMRRPPVQQPALVHQQQSSDDLQNMSALRQSLSNQSTAGSQEGDYNIGLTVGNVTVSDNPDCSQKVASSFRLSADRESEGHADRDNELQQREAPQEKEEVDLLPSHLEDDIASVELVSESRMTSISTNFEQQSTTTSPPALQRRQSHSWRKKQLSAIYDSLRQTISRRNSNNQSAKTSRNHRDSAVSSSELPPQAWGSNGANSTIVQQRFQHRRERRHRHSQEKHQQCSSSIGYGTWNERRTGEAAVFEDSSSPPTMTSAMRDALPSAANANESQANNVVFQHPPAVASAKQTSLMDNSCGGHGFDGTSRCRGTVCQSSQEGDCLYCSDDSLPFSWVSSLGNESNAVDLSISLDEASSNQCSTRKTLRKSSSRSRRRKQKPENLPAGEVTFQQLNTTEGHLTRLTPVVPATANCMSGDVRKTGLVKPSAVRDFAARSAIANTIFRPVSSEASCTTQEEEDEDDHLEVKLERIQKFKDVEERTDSGSASDQPFLMLEALSCGHEGLDCFGCYNRRKSITSATSWPAEQPPQQLSPHNSSPKPPPLPPLQPSSRSSKPAMMSSFSSPSSNVDLNAGALRDLLATVFNDPSEGRALTRNLMRGILCNVKSLRSTLAAALVLLKNRHGCSGPLTQAIGTADALDDLIRRLQNSQGSHSRSRSIRKHRLQKQQLQQQVLFRSEDEDDEDRSSSASVVVDAIQRCLHRRRQSRSRPVEHRCVPGAPVSSVQCHAMSHYIIGEQFVEPSLEQRSSLECRPVTTRVVLTETCKSVSQPLGSRSVRR